MGYGVPWPGRCCPAVSAVLGHDGPVDGVAPVIRAREGVPWWSGGGREYGSVQTYATPGNGGGRSGGARAASRVLMRSAWSGRNFR